MIWRHYIWLCILDVLSVRLPKGTVWFCINLDVLRAPNNVAVFRIGQADNSVFIPNWRFEVDRSGKPAALKLEECKYIYIPTYVCVCKCCSCTNDLWTYSVTRFSDVLSVRLPQGILSTPFNQFSRTTCFLSLYMIWRHCKWLCILDVLSVRLPQSTVWFCINLDVLRAPNNVAVFRIGQADNSVFTPNWKVWSGS